MSRLRPETGRSPLPASRLRRATGGGRTRALRAVSAAALFLTVVAGCTHIPVDGPVSGGDVAPEEPQQVFPQAYGPPPDASPVQVVQGFLQNQVAGVQDEYDTARQYLSGAVARRWDPAAGVVVYAGEPVLAVAEPSAAAPEEDVAPEDVDSAQEQAPVSGDDPSMVVVQGSLTVAASVDQQGQYTQAPAGARQDVSFRLRRDAEGQWRITQTADGVVMSSPNFYSVHRATSLYFPTPDGRHLVPDVRWFPQRNTATHAVRALLEGPSPWLRDAVGTAVPEGTRLTVGAVAVDETGLARVDLSSPVLTASPEERALLRAQLESTLLRVPGVRSVQVLSTGLRVSIPAGETPVRDQSPGDEPYAVSGGRLGRLSGTDLTPVPDLPALADLDVTALAVSGDGSGVPAYAVVRAGSDRLVAASRETAEPVVLLEGPGLVAPSVDRFGWTWSASTGDDGLVQAVMPGAAPSGVAADWLAGRDVVALRVSHDGARIAVVSEGAGGTRVDLSGVMRDQAGTPLRLADPVSVGGQVTDAAAVVWVDEATLAVLGRTGVGAPVGVQLVPVAGPVESLSALEGATQLAAGRGTRSLYLVTAEGRVYGRSATGVNWVMAVDGVQALAFPG